MKFTKKKKIIAAAAVILTLTVSTGLTVSYFSDYEAAMGQVALHMSGETQIQEQTADNEKVIQIVNTGEEGDASVVTRVMISPKDGDGVTYSFEQAGDWEKNGDYYYYKKVLAPGDSPTSKITVNITVKGQQLTPDQMDFNIIVNHESAIAAYEYDAANKVNKVTKPEGWDYIPNITAPVE